MRKNFPFIRDLRRCRRQDYVEAAKEVFATVLLAILPVWLGAVVLMLIPHASVGHYVGDFLSSGEALLISAALVGPSVYIITKKYGDLPKSLTIHFPQGWFLVLLWLVICMIITAIFGAQRIYAQVAHKTDAPALFDVASMQGFSSLVLFLAVASLYIVTVFRNFVEDGAASEMRADTAEFLKEWEEEK
jgi:hypothetical protein